MAPICPSCSREIEWSAAHRCEAEIGVILPAEIDDLEPPAPPARDLGREIEILSRLERVAPNVKTWLLSTDGQRHRGEVVRLLGEYVASQGL